jgi:hypothetical protein
MFKLFVRTKAKQRGSFISLPNGSKSQFSSELKQSQESAQRLPLAITRHCLLGGLYGQVKISDRTF